MRAIPALLTLLALALAGCGSYAPPSPTLSSVEQRQTAVAAESRPTLPPVPTMTPAPLPTIPAAALEVLKTSADDPRALGSPDAPVTIYEFTDFECPFCQKFFSETRPQLLTQYVDAGVVRLVARDFPLTQIHPSAMLGAIAGRCAADQQMFWPMYETLFTTHQQEWGGVPKRDREVMVELAGGIGIDQEAFRRCLDDPATERAVNEEQNAAAQLGVNSTPNFMINGQLIRGALPFSTFNQLIRSMVAPTN